MAGPNTLIGFLESNGFNSINFDQTEMPGSFNHGDYSMSAQQMDEAEFVGQQIKDLATQQGVDLTKFPEMKAVMGYDKDSNNLSAAELGCFVMGIGMEKSTSFQLSKTDPTSTLSHSFNLPASATQLATDLGQQVYGDNKPNMSSVDTTTPQSMDAIRKSPGVGLGR